jgi:hypothetical protein
MMALRTGVLGALLSALFACLSGCASSGPGAQVIARAWEGSKAESGTSAPLSPGVRYLRVDRPGGRSVLLALGYVEPHPAGEVLVWYSADGDVLRTLNGRIVGLAGLPTGFRVYTTEPAELLWPAFRFARFEYQRVRDDAMAYQFGHRDVLRVESASPPQHLLRDLPADARWPAAWSSRSGADVRWYREQMQQTTSGSVWPDAWYAVRATSDGVEQTAADPVVYSFQCVAPSLCFHLQPWPQVGAKTP